MSNESEPQGTDTQAKAAPEPHRDSRFRTAFAHRPVEMLCAFAMMVGGMVIAIAGGNAAWAAGGSFAAGLGGVLFSWSMASLNSREQAAEILRPHLDTSSKLLGTVSGQIARTIQDATSGRQDPATAFALMRQANGTLYNIVSDIQSLTGTEFDASGLTALIERLHELAERVSRDPKSDREGTWGGEAEDDTDIKVEIDALRRQIVTQLTQRGVPTISDARPVRVTCPECDASVSVALEVAPGSTASPRCPACGSRFNAHRKSDGSAFARPSGKPGSAAMLSPYERILRSQGLNLPDAAVRQKGLVALAKAITSRPNGRAKSWEDLEQCLSEELRRVGVDATEQEVKRLRQLGYRTRVYDLNAMSGIGLRDDISADNICDIVNKQLASRVFQNVDEDIDLAELAEVLFGDRSRQGDAGKIAADFDSIQRQHAEVDEDDDNQAQQADAADRPAAGR